MSILQITNWKFLVASQLVTQRYNMKRLIAMMHAKHLRQMPQVGKGGASSLRQVINLVSSHKKCFTSIITECACTRFIDKQFDAGHTQH